ncbi:MAG: hypothetical protein PHE89_04405 [Alphaproteobacteria bacterium]|nr:hypothetical protein [Alphaproteobacteria bacterium]
MEKKFLVIGEMPDVYRALCAKIDGVFYCDESGLSENDLLWNELEKFDGAIVFDSKEFDFAIVDEMVRHSKPVLFRNAYYESKWAKKVEALQADAKIRKNFLEELKLYDAAPIYAAVAEKIAEEVSTKNFLRNIHIEKDFAYEMTFLDIQRNSNAFLYALDLMVCRQKNRETFFYEHASAMIHIAGSVDDVQYEFIVDRAVEVDGEREEADFFFEDGSRLELRGNKLLFHQRDLLLAEKTFSTEYIESIEKTFQAFIAAVKLPC